MGTIVLGVITDAYFFLHQKIRILVDWGMRCATSSFDGYYNDASADISYFM